MVLALIAFEWARLAEGKQPTDTVQLRDVMVTEQRIQTRLMQAAGSYEWLQMKALKAQVGVSIPEVLSGVSGIDIRQRGPLGVQSDIGIRGGSFDQTQVLINGMKVNDPQTGHHTLNLPFCREALSQVEIIKTGASRVYGLNALAGSVNLITKVPDVNMVYAGVQGGDFGYRALHAGVVNHYRKLGQHLSVSKASSTGYRPNTDFEQSQLFYQANYLLNGRSALDFTGGYSERSFGAGGFYVPNSTEYETTKAAFAGLKYEWSKGQWRVFAQSYFRYHEDHYVFLRSNPSYYRNHHYSNVAALEGGVTYSGSLGVTRLGIDLREEGLHSSNLGVRSRTLRGMFVEQRFKALNNRLFVTPGVYMNQTNYSRTNWFPGLDASLLINSWSTLFAAVDQGMRLPTYTDLYYNGPSNIGNPNLVAETAHSAEVGTRFYKRDFQFVVALFQRNSNNLIDWVRQSSLDKWQPGNVNHVSMQGIETRITWRPANAVIHGALGYTWLESSLTGTENYISRYTLTNLNHQLIADCSIRYSKHLEQHIRYRYLHRMMMSDYHLFDSRLSYTHGGWNTFAEVSNISDVNYMEAGYVTMPGRWFKIGLEYRWIGRL